MGILNRLFGSGESVAKEIEHDDAEIIRLWEEYLKTISRKREIITSLPSQNAVLEELKKLLETELREIEEEEKDEAELLADLGVMSHSDKIKKVHRLEQCLRYPATRHEFVHGLLSHIHSILKVEMHLVRILLKGPKDAAKVIEHLKQQFHLEQEVLAKIGDLKTFHQMFLTLVKGQHIIRQMDAKEKKLLRKMQEMFDKALHDDSLLSDEEFKERYQKVVAQEWKKDVIRSWWMLVFDEIKVKVHECVADDTMDGYQQFNDFEFVNGPEFVELCRDAYNHILKRKVPEPMLNVFVHVFREWFNQR
ncbi:hypothetical protein HZB90_01625 [archaeon]|nr:hypothetical protein [archaeon]